MQRPMAAVPVRRPRAFNSFLGTDGGASAAVVLRTSMTALLVAIGYYVGSQIGFFFTPPHTPLSILWPPNAILLAAFLLTPRRIWWVLVLAIFPVHFLVQLSMAIPALSALGWFVGNVGEALLGAAAIHHFYKEKQPLFASVRGVITFWVFGVLLAPLLTSFLDAGSTDLTGLGSGYWTLWMNRLTSNMIANLTVAPAVVTLISGATRSFRKISWGRLFEAVQLIAGTAVVAWLVFARGSLLNYGAALICAPLPFLVWAAVRFGPAGFSFTMLEVTVMSVYNAQQGTGIFEYSTMPHRLIVLYTLLGLFVLPLMLLAAVVAERGDHERTLENAQGLLVFGQTEERHRIARELHTDIAGRLTLAGISLDELRGYLSASGKLLLNRLRDEISGALEVTLRLSHSLYPFGVEYLGLARAFTKLCLESRAEHGVIVRPSVVGITTSVPLGISLRVFRATQLALQDVQARQAKTATAELRVDGERIVLRLTDDGAGTAPGGSGGAGPAGMRAQLLALGGTLMSKPAPGGGLVMEASFPLTELSTCGPG